MKRLIDYPEMTRHLKQALFVLFATINVFSLQAMDTNEIAINQSSRELIAPAGDTYQWYYNDELIEGAVDHTFSPRNSGAYKVEVTDAEGNVRNSSIFVLVSPTAIRKIYVIGDSTVSNYNGSQYPFMGWGQVLQLFFDPGMAQVSNHARGGRSSRSFYEEGLWTPVKNMLAAGDYVLIQFGHNDRDFSKPERYTSPDSMKHFLRIYVNDSRAMGAIPVLVSPMSMNTGARNVFTEPGNDYRGAMIAVSNELNVPFLDLNMKSYNFYQQVGVEYAKWFVHMGLIPGEYPNYPNGYEDFWTHYQEMGALTMARFISEEISDQDTVADLVYLDSALKPLYPVNVNLSIPSAGMATVAGRFPEGANITLKSRLDDPNNTLKYWEDTVNNVTLQGNLVTFTMDTISYDFLGVITDCFGTESGTAKVDACNICSGGETGLPACTQSIPCVDICETNGDVELLLDAQVQYKLVLGSDSVMQMWLDQDVNVAATDSFSFGIAYLNPTAGESFDVYVDNTLVLTGVPLDVNQDWETKTFKLGLQNGDHTIRIQNTSATGGVKFDYVALFSQDVSGSSCPNPVDQQATAFGQSDSLIVIEAENYTELLPASNGSNWRKAIMEGAAAGRVVIAPEGTTYGSGNTAQFNAPISRYKVLFPNAGDYRIWARVYAFDPESDSYHLGLNEKVLTERIDVYNATNVHEAFTWIQIDTKTLPVATAGIHQLDVFCREPRLIIDKIILTQDQGYTPTGTGPEQTSISPTTSIEDGVLGANSLSMVGFPNPATQELHVEYVLPESGMVNVSVYNTAGQKVHEFVNERQPAGNQQVSWNFGDNPGISNGLYVIRLQSGSVTEMQKVLIQRQ